MSIGVICGVSAVGLKLHWIITIRQLANTNMPRLVGSKLSVKALWSSGNGLKQRLSRLASLLKQTWLMRKQKAPATKVLFDSYISFDLTTVP